MGLPLGPLLTHSIGCMRAHGFPPCSVQRTKCCLLLEGKEGPGRTRAAEGALRNSVRSTSFRVHLAESIQRERSVSSLHTKHVMHIHAPTLLLMQFLCLKCFPLLASILSTTPEHSPWAPHPLPHVGTHDEKSRGFGSGCVQSVC